MTEMLSIERLKEVLSYSPETGVFTHRMWRGGTARANTPAGSLSMAGYLRVRIDGKYYHLHRLAWLYTYGVWPKAEIDHINGDRADNRIENLREASSSQNKMNRKRKDDAQLKGVTFARHAKLWRARLTAFGKERHLGYFRTAEEAHDAYWAAAKECCGEFARRS